MDTVDIGTAWQMQVPLSALTYSIGASRSYNFVGCGARVCGADFRPDDLTSPRLAWEVAWREDTRRQPNGALHGLAAVTALGHPMSRMWAGYWQRGR
jgi:hypothetical protein